MNFHKMEVDIDGTLQLLVFSNHYYFYRFNLIFLHTGARRSGPAVNKMDLGGGGGGERKGVLFLTLVQTGIVDWNLWASRNMRYISY